jgi:hypothetical protein
MSVIIFYPNDVVDILLSSKLFKDYRYEPIKDCTAKDMVEAYYGRMKSIERHVSTPIHSMPNIYFEAEKIAYELGKDFLEPFFDGTIKGCEGFMALQCMDAGAWGKHYASIILFGTDSKGDPLPSTNGFKFFEKWPGRLLTETPTVLQRYFPACLNTMSLRSFPTRKANFIAKSLGFAKMSVEELDEIIDLQQAVNLSDDFAQRWEKLQEHVINNPSTGSGLKDVLPGASQNLAFKIEKIEMKALLDFMRPEKIACILCINDNKIGAEDDSLSIIFAAVKKDTTTGEFVGQGFAGIEKWPGLHMLAAKDKVKEKILTHADAAVDKAEFEPVRASLDLFEGIWKILLDDTDGSITKQRPDIILKEHPIVFFIDPAGFGGLLNAGAEYIAGVFGFDNTAKVITPYFVGIDATENPMSPILNVTKNLTIDPPILVKDKNKVNDLILK